MSAAERLARIVTGFSNSSAAAGDTETAPRLGAYWRQHNTMTAARPSLPLVRWAVQPIWWANDDVQDPDTAIDLQSQLPVLQEVSEYYMNIVRAVRVRCLCLGQW